jgi:hypothetical protein
MPDDAFNDRFAAGGEAAARECNGRDSDHISNLDGCMLARIDKSQRPRQLPL